jgi:hypothetical protein
VLILKEDKVICYDTLLEVLILKGVKEEVNGQQGKATGIGRSFEQLPVAGESAAGFRGNQDIPVGGGTKAGWHRRGIVRRWRVVSGE